ncbi:MAG: AMP-binding protein, partial [Pseudomonadota bacterium]
MNPAIWLDRTAALTPDAPALLIGERVVADYAAFRDCAARVAGGLAARGVGRGDRVAIFSKNRVEYLIALYAIWRLGAAAVPINGKLHEKETAWIIGDAEAGHVFVSGGFDEPVEAALIDFDGPDWAALE